MAVYRSSDICGSMARDSRIMLKVQGICGIIIFRLTSCFPSPTLQKKEKKKKAYLSNPISPLCLPPNNLLQPPTNGRKHKADRQNRCRHPPFPLLFTTSLKHPQHDIYDVEAREDVRPLENRHVRAGMGAEDVGVAGEEDEGIEHLCEEGDALRALAEVDRED